MKLKAAFICFAAMTVLHCTHKEVREPASVKAIITDGETQALADLFGGDSPLNTYRHPMRVQFHTNGDKKYLSETARKALNQALIETLGVENPEQGLAKLAAGNLRDALVENFIKTLRVYKIINTGLQMDLIFAPVPNQKNSYADELSSNQLIRFGETGRLSQKWDQLDKETVTGNVYNNSTSIPAKPGEVDYIGGALSLYLEILDTKPKFGLPSPKKNGVKGFVRYRRFYRLNKEASKTATCDNFTMSSKASGVGVPLFYTVDLYKNFNLAKLIPTEETLEVFPGLIASMNEGRAELMPDTFEKTGKSISTGRFLVAQKRSTAGEISFSLKKIVYDLKEKSLDRSRTEVDLVEFYSNAEGGIVAESQALSAASNYYLKKCEASMEKFLGLESFVQGGLL